MKLAFNYNSFMLVWWIVLLIVGVLNGDWTLVLCGVVVCCQILRLMIAEEEIEDLKKSNSRLEETPTHYLNKEQK